MPSRSPGAVRRSRSATSQPFSPSGSNAPGVRQRNGDHGYGPRIIGCVAERWGAFLNRRADAQLSRANLAAMRHGLLPAGWVYGLNDERQAEFDEQRRIMFELAYYKFREPVTGPDGVAVAIWLEGTTEYQEPMFAFPTRWPGAQPGRLSAVARFCLRIVNSLMATRQLSYLVQAHAMFGPPAAVIRRFALRQHAADFGAQLAQQVRTRGIEALRDYAEPGPADQG